MLPRIIATPRAGSTVPITRPAGTFTTKIISDGQRQHVDQDVEGQTEECVRLTAGPPREIQ